MERAGRTIRTKSTALALLATATLVSPALPSDAEARAPARSDEGPVLTSVTKIVGSRTASVSVRLPHDATLTFPRHGPSPDATITGSGRYAGVVLVSEEWEGGLLHEDVFIANRWGFCEQRGSDPEKDVLYNYRGLTRNRAGDAVLPAGTYRLHVLADGAPVEVTLRLHGAPRGTS